MRLQPQVGAAMINANRNLAAYESFGVPVWPDTRPRLRRSAVGLPGRAGARRDAVRRDRALRHARTSPTTWWPAWPTRSRPRTPSSRWCARPTAPTPPGEPAAPAGVLPAARHAAGKPGSLRPRRPGPQDRPLDRAAPLRDGRLRRCAVSSTRTRWTSCVGWRHNVAESILTRRSSAQQPAVIRRLGSGRPAGLQEPARRGRCASTPRPFTSDHESQRLAHAGKLSWPPGAERAAGRQLPARRLRQ